MTGATFRCSYLSCPALPEPPWKLFFRVGGVLLLDVCEYFLLVHGGFLLFVNKIISPLDTSLEVVRGVGKSGFVVFYVLYTVFFNML